MLSECACLNVRKAARAVTQRFDDALRPAGLRSTQLPLLAATALYGRINVSALAEEVVLDPTTLSRTLALLERRGWIGMSPGEDRRTREVHLTPDGSRVLERAIPLWEDAQAQVATPLQAQRLRRALLHLSAPVKAGRPG